MKKIIFLLILAVSPIFSQNQNISEGFIFNGEPNIVVNPNNPQHIVVAWMGFESAKKIAITTRTSFDGGITWTEKVKIPHENNVYSSADPTMDFDNNGNIYLAYVDFDAPVETADSGAVYIRKSTDGGLSWGQSYKVTDMKDEPGKKAIDRPWLVIDRSGGKYIGNNYITTMNAKGAKGPYNPYFHVSSDGGKSWQTKYMDSAGFLAGPWIHQPMPTPAVSSNGTFHAIYPSYVTTQNVLAQYIHVSSADGGKTFQYTSVYSDAAPFTDSLAKKAPLLIADNSDSLHLAFFNISDVYGDGDVFLWETFDGGKKWIEQGRINDDSIGNGKMQDLVWADFNEKGDLFASWRDRRNAPLNSFETSSEIWGALKTKGATKFAPNFCISDALVPYDTILGASSGNDFQGVRFTGNTIYSVWGSNKDNFLNIWFAKSEVTPSSVKELFRSEIGSDIEVIPNPASDFIRICINGKFSTLTKVEIYSSVGTKIFETEYKDRIDISFLSPGIYFLKAGNKVYKFVKY
jgi:hypothetical protein